MTRRPATPTLATEGRHEAARRLGMHADTLTARMRDGAGAAVVEWGGRGKLMTFSKFHLNRWASAFRCTLFNGKPCAVCWTTLDDCRITAAHLLETRHGVNGCEECTAPWLQIPHAKETTA